MVQTVEGAEHLRQVSISVCDELVAFLLRGTPPWFEDPENGPTRLAGFLDAVTMAMPEGWRGKVTITRDRGNSVSFRPGVSQEFMQTFLYWIQSPPGLPFCPADYKYGYLVTIEAAS